VDKKGSYNIYYIHNVISPLKNERIVIPCIISFNINYSTPYSVFSVAYSHYIINIIFEYSV